MDGFITGAQISRHLRHNILAVYHLKPEDVFPPLPPGTTHVIGINGPSNQRGTRWLGDVFPPDPYPFPLPAGNTNFTIVFVACYAKSERRELGELFFRDYCRESREEIIKKFVSMDNVPRDQSRLRWKDGHVGLGVDAKK